MTFQDCKSRENERQRKGELYLETSERYDAIEQWKQGALDSPTMIAAFIRAETWATERLAICP